MPRNSDTTPLPDLASRIKLRLDALDMKEREASRRAGFGLGYVGDIISGRSKEPAMPRLIKLAEVLECDLEYLLGTNPVAKRPAEVRNFDPPNYSGESRVRLINLYSASPTSEFGLGQMIHTPIDKVQAIPSLAHVTEAYAFAIFSNTMEPRYYVGEVVFAHPGLPPRAGDFVIFRLKSGAVAVVRYIGPEGTEHRFEFLNLTDTHTAVAKADGHTLEAGRLSLASDDIDYIHRVVGSAS